MFDHRCDDDLGEADQGRDMSELARLHPDDIAAIVQGLAERRAETGSSPAENAAVSSGASNDPLLTAAEAAEILGYTELYVWRLGREGTLARFKHPGRKYVRYPKSAVLAFREAGYQQPTPRATAHVASAESVGLPQRADQTRTRRRF